MLRSEQQPANTQAVGTAQPHPLKWQAHPHTGLRTITVEDRVFTLVPHFVHRKLRCYDLTRLQQQGWDVMVRIKGSAAVAISIEQTVAAAERFVNDWEETI